MNKGFLIFSEEEPGMTILKDEPEDLTHLAPTAGDVDVPLEASFFTSDMLDEFILSDNYVPLLEEDINVLSESQSSHSGSNKSDGSDPFFAYRDESSSSGGSPSSHLHSPALSKSPGDCSIPSLCSPGDSGDGNNMSPFLSLNLDSTSMSDGDEDMTMRAPYIPMTEGDDFPLLMPTDLMWGAPLDKSSSNKSNSSSRSSWSPSPLPPKASMGSSLAQLLVSDENSGRRSSRTQPLKCNDHGGGLVDPNEVLGQPVTKDGRIIPTGSMEWTAIPGLPLSRMLPQRGNGHIGSTAGIRKSSPGNAGSPERPYKRSCTPATDDQYDIGGSKRTKSEIKMPQKVPSQLFQQLIQPSATRQAKLRTSQGDSVWVLDGGGTSNNSKQQPQQQKQAPLAPSDSVLMNLLANARRSRKGGGVGRGGGGGRGSIVLNTNIQLCKTGILPEGSCIIQCDDAGTCLIQIPVDEALAQRKENIRKNSFSLLDPEGATVPSLLDLSQRDCEVNAPVISGLLQGQDLLKALESSTNALVD